MRRRSRHQVVLQLMPGSEPWIRVEAGTRVLKMPADVSVLELWERLESRHRPPKHVTGELLVRARLDQLVNRERTRQN